VDPIRKTNNSAQGVPWSFVKDRKIGKKNPIGLNKRNARKKKRGFMGKNGNQENDITEGENWKTVHILRKKQQRMKEEKESI